MSTKKKVYVEPKKVKREGFVLDVSNRVINRMPDLLAEWEMYVSLSGELPDEILMNERQYIWFTGELRRFAEVMALPNKAVFKPTFRGLPVKKRVN